jgi:hypothetical protein
LSGDCQTNVFTSLGAITLYQPERDSFRFLAAEGELLSDYFKTALELAATKPGLCRSPLHLATEN